MEKETAEGYDWRDDAKCKIEGTDPNYFYPLDEEDPDYKRIIADFCGGCVVKSQCLDFAIENREPAGFWGGVNTAEREKIRKQRRRLAS